MDKSDYKYYILKQKNLIVEVLRGSFDLQAFINLKKSETSNPDFDPAFSSILDIRGIENSFSKDIRNDLERFLEIIKTIQGDTKRKRTAVITHTPAQVTGITWYKLIDDRGIDYEVFSTLKGATEWLGVNEIDLKDIDFMLKDR